MGVNGHSNFEERLALWLKERTAQRLPPSEKPPAVTTWKKVGNSFWHAAMWAVLYFSAGWLGQWFWNNELHHRAMTVRDVPRWVLSFLRKIWYRHTEKEIESLLYGKLEKQFFLVPLQVHNDSQIRVHSNFDFVMSFIGHVMRSFAKALAQEQSEGIPPGRRSIAGDMLVFKHHPLDRGHRNYADAIRLLAEHLGLQEKVAYIHDQHLPTLLKNAKGVVLVNSTTGLSALGHGAPVKVCGNALYDLPGLTFQGNLRDFWFLAHAATPNKAVLSQFREALIECTQVNGSFYRKLPGISWHCGIALEGELTQRLWGNKRSTETVVSLARFRFDHLRLSPLQAKPVSGKLLLRPRLCGRMPE